MLEIPESVTLARQLNETVKGKRIADAEAEHTKHGFAWYEGDPSAYAGIMRGKQIGESMGIGSMVEIALSPWCLLLGDGVNLRYFPPGKKLPDRYQMRITLEEVLLSAGIFLLLLPILFIFIRRHQKSGKSLKKQDFLV